MYNLFIIVLAGVQLGVIKVISKCHVTKIINVVSPQWLATQVFVERRFLLLSITFDYIEIHSRNKRLLRFDHFLTKLEGEWSNY